MRKLLALIFILSCYANAQFATTSGTITDGAGQAFKNGTYKVELVPAFGFNNTVRTDTGLPVTPTQVFGTLDGTGSFAGVVLTRTDFIGPAGALWKWTICPDATSGCIIVLTSITSAAPSLTTQLSAAAGTIVVGTNYIKNVIPTAYTSTELFGMTKGSLYFNTTTNNLFTYDGSTWNAVGGGAASCATVNNLCKSDGVGGFLNSTIVDTGSLITMLDGTAASPTVKSATGGNIGWYFFNSGTQFRIEGGGNDLLQVFAGATNSSSFQGISTGQFCLGSTATVGTTCDTFLTRKGAANWHLGAADAASPIVQIFGVQGGTGANTPGVNWTIQGSNGTGTGGGGSIIFQTGLAHGSDSIADTFTTAMTIDNGQNTNITKLKVNGSQALSSVQGSTGTAVAVATGSFTAGNLTTTDSNGNFIDSGALAYKLLDKQDPAAGVNGNSADQTVYTYSMPANTLPSGKCLKISFFSNRSAGAGAPILKIFFGATTVSTVTTTNSIFTSVATVCNNTGSGVAQWATSLYFDSGPSVTPTQTSPAEDTTSGSIVIKGTFNVAAGTSVAGKGWFVERLP